MFLPLDSRETETQKGRVTCLRSRRWRGAVLGPQVPDSRPKSPPLPPPSPCPAPWHRPPSSTPWVLGNPVGAAWGTPRPPREIEACSRLRPHPRPPAALWAAGRAPPPGPLRALARVTSPHGRPASRAATRNRTSTSAPKWLRAPAYRARA